MSEEETKEEQLSDVELVPDEENDLLGLQKKIKGLKGELTKCGEERKEYLEGWQRAKADHINYRNDEGKRFEDMARFVTAGFIQEVLPALDSFDLALGHNLSQDVEKGILLIRSQFEDILRKRGLETIEVHAGEEFNPERHEGVGEVESDIAIGEIAEIIQRGYVFHNRVLRPARVRISKGRS